MCLLAAPICAAVATRLLSHGSCSSPHFFWQPQNQPQGTLLGYQLRGPSPAPQGCASSSEMPARAKPHPVLGGPRRSGPLLGGRAPPRSFQVLVI